MDSEPNEQKDNVNKPTFRSKYLSKNPLVPWKRLVDFNLDVMSKANKSSQNHYCASAYHFDNIVDDCDLTSYADCSSCERECTLTNNAEHSRYEPVSSHLKENLTVEEHNDEVKSSQFTEMRFTNVGLFGKSRKIHGLDDCGEYIQGEITSSRKTRSRSHPDHKTVDQLNELRQKHDNITCLDASNQKHAMSVPQWSTPNPRDCPKRDESDDETSDLTKRTEVSSDHSFKKTMLRDDKHFVHLNDSEIEDSGFATRDVTMLSFRYSGSAETNTDYESDWDDNEGNLTTDCKELHKNSTVHYSDQNAVTDIDSHTSIEQEAAENSHEILKMNDLPEVILEESTNVSNHIVKSPPTGLHDTEVIISLSDNKHIFKSNGFENGNPLKITADKIERTDDQSDTKATKFIYTKTFSPISFSRCPTFLDASCAEHSTYSYDMNSKVSDCLSPLVQCHNFQRDKDKATITTVSERKIIESVSNESQPRLKCERLLGKNGIAEEETFLSKTVNNDVCNLVQRESENYKYINTYRSEDIISHTSTSLDIYEVRNAANIESCRRLKFLTRNPLTSWKRFVDVNIESLNFKKSISISSNGADKVGHSIAKCQSNTETDRTIECIDSHRQKCAFTNLDLSGLQDDDYSGIFNKCKTNEELGEENEEMTCVSVVIDDLQFDERSSSNVFTDDRIENVFSLSNERTPKNNDRFAVGLDSEKHSQQNDDIDSYVTHDNVHSQQTETTQNLEYAETVPLDFPLQNCINYPKETVESGSLNLTATLHNTPQPDCMPDSTLSVQPEHENANSVLDKVAKGTENYPSNILLEATLENQYIQVLLLPDMLYKHDEHSNGFMPTNLLGQSQEHGGSQLRNERYIRSKYKSVPRKSNDRQKKKIKSRLRQQKYDTNEINKKTLHELEVADVSRTSIDVEPKDSYDILGTVWSKLSKYMYGLVKVFNSSIQEDGNLQQFNSASSKENNITTSAQGNVHERSEYFIKGDCVSKSMPDSKDRFISESDLRKTSQVQIKKHSKRRKINSSVETFRTDTTAQNNENSFSTESQLPFQTGDTSYCKLEFHNKINADYCITKGSQSSDESFKYYNASPNNRDRLVKYARQGQGQSEIIIDTKSVPNEKELSAFFENNWHSKSSQTLFTTAKKFWNCQKDTSTTTVTQVLPENETSTNFPKESFRKLNLLTQTLPTILRSNPSLNIVNEREELCSKQMHGVASDEDVMTDDMLKSSLECLLEMLLQRGKVSQAFVATVEGELLAKTSGLPVKEQDVMTIVCCLTSSYQGVTRITLFTISYQCFKLVQSSTLVGRADESIFVALQGKQAIVVGFAHPSSPGSCIREIQELSQALSQRGL